MPSTGKSLTIALAPVRVATATDLDWLATLLATAFHSDAVAEWIFPDPGRRREILPAFFRAFCELSLEHGTVYTTQECDGALLTLAPGADPGPGFESRLRAIVGEHARALSTVVELQHEQRPGTPHHYVSFAAAAQRRSSAGAGTAMLRPLIALSEETGTPIYTEVSSGGGYATARRNGFTRIGAEIRVPGGPILRPMWREPQSHVH